MGAQYTRGMVRYALAVLLVVGCAHAPPPAHPHEQPHPATSPIPLPYHLVDGRSGARLDDAAFDAKLRAARVVYVGEEHPNPHHHAAQIEVLERLHQLDPSLALGLEMLPRTLQAPLDDFIGGKLDEQRFLEAVDWKKTWGYPFGLYAPLLRFSRDHHLRAVALNAPRSLTMAVAKRGVTGLTPDEKKQLPEMQPGPEAHREQVREAFGAHPHGKFSQGQFERFYAAQLVWDETMATRVAETLGAADAPHRLLVIAGEGHVRHHAVPDRAVRRGAGPYLLIVALFEPDLPDALKENVADVLWVFDDGDKK
jgi:uncharacterized iron-regulated protein